MSSSVPSPTGQTAAPNSLPSAYFFLAFFFVVFFVAFLAAFFRLPGPFIEILLVLC